VIRGLGLTRTDHELFAVTEQLFDALYELRKQARSAG
jgi:hypothetical protein